MQYYGYLTFANFIAPIHRTEATVEYMRVILVRNEQHNLEIKGNTSLCSRLYFNHFTYHRSYLLDLRSAPLRKVLPLAGQALHQLVVSSISSYANSHSLKDPHLFNPNVISDLKPDG